MSKNELKYLYIDKCYSVRQIADQFNCSQSRINYWLKQYGVKKRSISEAIYLKRNPDGSPFKIVPPKNRKMFLFGLGLGLYWGEGTKSNKYSVRIGNTDARLIQKFIEFLDEIYFIKKEKLKFGLQIFNDCSKEEAMKYWISKLNVSQSQFQKPIISEIRGKGTYKKKSKYGVLTVYYNNKKLRDIICNEIEKL